ncbi:hypothetical protein [Marinovum sp.]|uniref:hypothetical protein n=1 Tax=Marinovum sp. TaxID=2024839 RepID=UPI002B26B389|nr:hypothetical protein [Marinovum sp.]
MSFLQPSPAVMALLSLQTFLYLPLLAMLAAARTGAARGPSRWLGLASLLLALLGMAAHFGPPLLNLYTGPLPQLAAGLTKPLGGMMLPLLASAPLLASRFAPGRGWRWVDWAHLLLLAVLLGLWGFTRFY